MQKKQKEIRAYVSTRYGDHLCILEPDEKKGFIVTVPDLQGVITWGRNISHAKEMVKEAIELCIESRVKESIHQIKRNQRSTIREPLAV